MCIRDRWYTDDDPEQLLRLFLDEIADNPVNVVRMRKKELFMAACKQAIKADVYKRQTQAGFGQVCAALEEKLLHSGDFFINAEYIIDQPSVFSEEELAIIEGILKKYHINKMCIRDRY